MKHKKLKSKILAFALIVTTCITFMPSIAFAEPVPAEGSPTTESIQPEVPEADVNEEGVGEESISTASEEIDADATLNTADADSPLGMIAKASKTEITVTINGVGSSGTAELYRFDASEYYTGDNFKGMSKSVTKDGAYIDEYTCGGKQEFVFNRYNNDGTDNLYDKYYLIQNGKILAGPVYVSEVSSMRSNGRFDATKKGLTVEDGSTLAMAKEMGVGNTVINMDLCTLIYDNEDENGNPIDNTKNANAIEFESNGEMFYFNADYVSSQDALISSYSKAGINVSIVLISWAKTYTKDYPSELLYLPASKQAHTMGFNTSTERGAEYWIAAMEFLANRYSKSARQGLIQQYIVGNEIDYTYDWYLMQPEKNASGKYQRVEFNTFMEEYARTLRLANLAVKKYNSEAKVCVSLTHNWAKNCLESYGYKPTDTSIRRYNSYAPKEILDWLVKYEGARGDYDWGIAAHPYPIGTSSSNPLKTDVNTDPFNTPARRVMPVTGNWKTTPWVTVTNLEVYQLYLQQPENKVNGKDLRSVFLTETSICNVGREADGSNADEVRTSQLEAAASIAMTYYRAANLECVKSIDYFQPHDQNDGAITNKLGLMELDGTKKPAYNVWKYIDTNRSFTHANKYLKNIAPDAKSYKELMPTVKSEFNWEAYWNEKNIMVRNLATSDVKRSLILEKEEFDADEAINVIATGGEMDTVGLFKADDNVATEDPIYYYNIKDSSKVIKFKSGEKYDLISIGSVSPGRVEDANLKAGDYKIVLISAETGEVADSCESKIKIKGEYFTALPSTFVRTDKAEYQTGEAISVSAAGGTDSAWVGLYKKNDTYGSGATTSIYWYYINDSAKGVIPGRPTVIQNTTHNSDSSNPGVTIAPGEYVLYLFKDSGYSVIDSATFTVKSKENIEPLVSIKYELDNDTDGFANGVVTVEKADSNDEVIDCVMYWADAEGQPLEGYTALAKFKLKGEVTNHEMYDYTIIPDGAKKLIAYASEGGSISKTAVSTDLPENCGYKLEDDYLVEFQMMSDIHITTDDGAKGEVKLSNQHFSQMMEDVKTNSPESIGIFVNGDIADNGKDAEYKKLYDMYFKSKYAGNGNLPALHLAMGNHDWRTGNPNGQFQKYAQMFNDNLKEQPKNVYYHEEVAGYDFIYLSGEAKGDRAALSNEQIEWFDETMAEITAKDPDKPVFVLLHQGLYNTVAGTLPGQGWDGVTREGALKKVLKKYGQIIMFAGHSHWELDSESNMYPGDDEMSVAVNTASLGYLWTSYNTDGGEFADGSNAYYVRIYEDKVVFMGREFEQSKWVPSGMFIVQRNDITTSAESYNIPLDAKAMNLEAKSADGSEITFSSTKTAVAGVTADGTVIPKRVGTAEIIMTVQGGDTTVMNRERVTVTVTEGAVERIYGKDRYKTAYKAADTLKEKLGVEKFDNIIIANGTNFADALAGSYLAAKKDAPILLTSNKKDNVAELQKYVNANIKRGGTVYLLGGDKAVADSVETGLENCTVERLAGADRYATNLAILEEAGVESDEIIACTGDNFADSLSASASERPILLVGKNGFTNAQVNYLTEAKAKTIYVIGGEKAMSESTFKSAGNYASNVKRLAGEDRYETSVRVAEEFFKDPNKAVVVYGQNFPDGLSGGPLAVSLGGPLILSKEGSEAAAAVYAEKAGITSGMVLGGPTLIPDPIVKKVFRMGEGVHIVVR